LRFAPLDDAAIDGVLRQEAPEADAATRAAAIAAAHGSPGAALGFIEARLAPVHALLSRIVTEGDPGMMLRAALAEELGARPSRERLAATLDLARAVLVERIASASRAAQAEAIEAHAALVRLAGQVPTYNFEPPMVAMEVGALLARAASA
jgi:DNA polymerase-3 subunit delta'